MDAIAGYHRSRAEGNPAGTWLDDRTSAWRRTRLAGILNKYDADRPGELESDGCRTRSVFIAREGSGLLLPAVRIRNL
jgi:hypothetical protein